MYFQYKSLIKSAVNITKPELSVFFTRIILLILSGLMTSSLQSCGKKAEESPAIPQISDTTATNKGFTLNQNVLLTAGIEFEPAVKAMFPYRFKANGKVSILANAQADVASPFKGTVKKFFTKEGQYLSKGQAILELNVPELVHYQEQYLQTKGELSFLSQEVARQEALQSENVGALKNLQEVRSKILAAEARLQAAAAILNIADIQPESLSNGTNFISTYTLKAPISGYISHFSVTLGAPASEGTILTHINNIEDLYADVFIYEKDIQKVKAGQVVSLTFADPKIPVLSGKIEYIGKELDPKNKTVMLHIPFAVPKGIMILPEMQVTAKIETGVESLHTLPEQALIHGEDGDYIFYTENPKSEKVEIRVLPLPVYTQQHGKIGISNLPSEGLYFAVKNANIVNGEYKRSEMEEE